MAKPREESTPNKSRYPFCFPRPLPSIISEGKNSILEEVVGRKFLTSHLYAMKENNKNAPPFFSSSMTKASTPPFLRAKDMLLQAKGAWKK